MSFIKTLHSLTRRKTRVASGTNKTTIYNILIVAECIIDNDTGRIIANFANYLRSCNVGVCILCKQVGIRLLFEEQIGIISVGNSFSHKLRFMLNAVVKNKKIDVVLLHNINLTDTVVNFCCRKKILMIVSVYSILNASSLGNKNVINNVEQANLILSVSDEVSNFLLNHFNIEPDRILQFALPVDDDLFDSGKITKGRVKEVLKDIDIDIVSKKIFFCPYDYDDLSDIIPLFRALSVIDRDDFIVVVSGIIRNNINNYQMLLSIVKKMRLFNKVRVVREISDRSAIVASSYASIYIEQSEGSFAKLLCETGMMKKPSIAIMRQTNIAYIVNELTGICVKNDNILEIRSALVRILELTDNEYQKMCMRSYKYAKKHFSKNLVLEKINNEILNLVHKNIELLLKREKHSIYKRKSLLFKKNK